MSLRRIIDRQISPITDRVFLTGVSGVSDVHTLLDAKITHVLNVAKELDNLTYPDHIKVRFVDLRDSADENLLPHFDDLVDHIHHVVTQGGRMVVHCVAGVSRSASVCIAYLMKHHDMSLKDAHAKVKEARDAVNPNMGFWTNLIEYELQFRTENSVELLPYVAGTVPSIESYKKEMAARIRLGWMDDVFYTMAGMAAFLLIQMAAIFCFRE